MFSGPFCRLVMGVLLILLVVQLGFYVSQPELNAALAKEQGSECTFPKSYRKSFVMLPSRVTSAGFGEAWLGGFHHCIVALPAFVL